MADVLYAILTEGKAIVTLFGMLCLLLHIVIPYSFKTTRFLLVTLPTMWRDLQIYDDQQFVLKRLRRKIDALRRKRLEMV